MPTVSISRYEIEQEILPPVCIVTGEPTTFAIRHHFRWLPSWVYGVSLATASIYGLVRFTFSEAGVDAPLFLLVFTVVPLLMVGSGLVNAKPFACEVPIARRKRYYWVIRKAGGLIGVMTCLALIISGYTHSNELSGFKSVPDYGLWAFRIGLVGFIVVGIILCIANRNSIHPTEIGATHVTLANVHADFAAALEIERTRELHREAERRVAYEASQKRKDAALLAGWRSGPPRARRHPTGDGSDSGDDGQTLLKSAEDELRAAPPKPEEPPSGPANPRAPT